jgi:hypothetical protein
VLIVISGVKPYDGRYELDFAQELTTREWGWVKRLSGYLPLDLEKAAAGGDPEFACALAAIALRRAGRVEAREVPEVFERLADAPFGSAISIEVEDSEGEEGDAGPPERSSNGNESSSGAASRMSSEMSESPSPAGSGMPDSDTSESDRPTWVS